MRLTGFLPCANRDEPRYALLRSWKLSSSRTGSVRALHICAWFASLIRCRKR